MVFVTPVMGHWLERGLLTEIDLRVNTYDKPAPLFTTLVLT